MTELSNKTNPFPGLRHYSPDESHLFFGRSREREEVIKRLLINRFIAVIGPTGSGKSSLIHAGVVPLLSKGLVPSTGKKWRIINIRPGISPIDNMAEALVKSELQNDTDESEEIRYNIKNALLRNSRRGLTEALRQLYSEYNENILLIIDHFEELFRIAANRTDRNKQDEYEAFIKLLSDTVNEESLPAYIVVSMRNDYIEDAVEYNDLSLLINKSNFFLASPEEESVREIITEPIRTSGGEIDGRLLSTILRNDITYAVKLPFLQYVLMRMWNNRARKKDDSKFAITEKDYDEVGRIEGALPLHADEAFEELSDNGKLICEKLFRIVAVRSPDNRFLSNPTRVSDIAFITRTAVSDVIDVIERFRRPDRSFLQPRYRDPLNSDSFVELTHEVLILMWPRLRNWVEKEYASVKMYRRLSEASRKYQMGKEQLLTPPFLQAAIKWREENKPSFEWAQRYDTAFERTMAYVKKSEEAYNEKEEDKVSRPARLLKRTRVFAGLLGVLIITLSALTFHYARLFYFVEKELESVAQLAPDTPAATEDVPHTETAEPESIAEPEQTARLQQPPPARISQPDEEDLTETVEETATEITPVETTTSEQPEETITTAPQPDERSESYARRMLAISHTIAVKSLQEQRDSELKALLAVQAHIFNQKYGGRENHADIFQALYSSIKRLYDENFNVFKGHNESVNSVVFSPAEYIFYSASSDGKVLSWNLNDESKTPRTLINIPVIINNLTITPNGQWLACSTEGRGIQVINPSRNNPVPIQVNWGNNRINAIDFYPDNENLLFAGSDNSIVKWNIRTREHRLIYESGNDIMSLAVSPDGRKIAAGTRSGQILFWDDEHSAPRTIREAEGDAVYSVGFSSNGELLAAGSLRGNLVVWNIANRSVVAGLTGHTARIMDVQFSPDDKKIASVSFDGTVQLWDALNLKSPPVVFSEHESWVHSVAFSHSGNRLVTGSRDGSRLILRPARSAEMIPLICQKLTRNFTRNEWDLYVGDDVPMTRPCP